MKSIALTLAVVPVCLFAQPELTLRDAVGVALDKHPSMEAGAARVAAAESRIRQARAGWLPKVQYSESFTRSNNPVYVFGSLLTQRRFTESNFAIDSLNRPDALNNFQSQLSLDQTVWDFGQTRYQVRAAELGRQLSGEDRRRLEMQLIAGVARTYHGAVLARQAMQVAAEAVKSAQADLEQAEAVRAAGLSTDADVLSIRVHVAAAKEQEIRRRYEAEVAAAALNEALGLPLDTPHTLSTSLAPAPPAGKDTAEYEQQAARLRPEAVQSRLTAELADAQTGAARSALWPQIGVRGIFEADRGRFGSQGGGNWLLAASLRWNVFSGFQDRARVAETVELARAARAGERQATAGIQLQVRQAEAERKAAEERITVAEATVTMAEESLRIVRNRYRAGLATVTELLRNETALVEARNRRLAAVYDQRIASAMLELAAGSLNRDSEVLQ